MNFYDCHTHLNYEPLSANADHIANLCNVKNIILNNVGTNLQTSQMAIDLAKLHKNIFAIVGIHPNDINPQDFEKFISQMHVWLSNKQNKIVAIGETGLDYHYDGYDKQLQFKYLKAHWEFAKQYNLPLMIHVRDAHDDMIDFIKQNNDKSIKIVIHCYTDNKTTVKKYVDLGCYISIPGVITFKNASLLKEAIHYIPTNKLLSETDAPWLTPVPYRGKHNSPEYISFIVEAIAAELKMNNEKISEIIFNNTKNLFKI